MKFVLSLYLFWLGLIFIFVGISSQLLVLSETYLGTGTQYYQQNPQLAFRANFDGMHYLQIASRGYGFAQQAFFPLYPHLINLGNQIISDRLVSAVVVSNLSLVVALFLMYLLVKEEFSQSISRWTVTTFLFFPVAFFLTSVYTESVFIMLVITSMFFYRRQKIFLAVICGALASYTRLAGVLLIPAFAIDLFHRKNFSPSAWISICLIGTGLIIYMIQSWYTTGDPLVFMSVQQHFGQDRSQDLILLPQVFWRYLKIILTMSHTQLQYLTVLLEIFSASIFLVTSLIGLKKTPPYLGVFSLLAYLLPTFTGTFASLPRYCLACLSSFVVFALLLHRQRKLAKIVSIASMGTLLFVFTALFARGYWVS